MSAGEGVEALLLADFKTLKQTVGKVELKSRVLSTDCLKSSGFSAQFLMCILKMKVKH